ncbi:MAG TPA: metalloregulator ArsR/SmtB family transcription factor [Verrucomicrobiales bacterium]|nr:metalloregulator ArsR/SmtB family transcription factor [Verrucomicrobiales bacterium]
MELQSSLSEETLAETVRMMGVLSDPARIRIVNLIQHGNEICNCQIGPVTGYLASKISRHLTLLKQAGLLRERRDGTFIYYQMKAPDGPVHTALLELISRICDSDPLLSEDREKLDSDNNC